MGYYEGPKLDELTLTGESIASISFDGRLIAVTRPDGSAFVWNAAELRQLTALELPSGRELRGFSPDKRLLLSVDVAALELHAVRDGRVVLSVPLSPPEP